MNAAFSSNVTNKTMITVRDYYCARIEVSGNTMLVFTTGPNPLFSREIGIVGLAMRAALKRLF